MIPFKTTLTFLAICVALFSGCGSKDKTGSRIPVSGDVTLDGKPLSDSMIVLVSLSDSDKTKATGIIKSGKFEIKQQNGPIAGPNRVHVYPMGTELEELTNKKGQIEQRDLFKQKCPVKYGKKSKLKITIPEGGDKKIRLRLKS